MTQPDRPRGRGHEGDASTGQERRGRALALPCCSRNSSKDEAFLDGFARSEPDLGVVAAYGRILPQRLLDAAATGHDQRARVAAAALARRRAGASRHSRRRSMRPASQSCASCRRSTPARCWRRAVVAIGPDETSRRARDAARAASARTAGRDARPARRGSGRPRSRRTRRLVTYAPQTGTRTRAMSTGRVPRRSPQPHSRLAAVAAGRRTFARPPRVVATVDGRERRRRSSSRRTRHDLGSGVRRAANRHRCRRRASSRDPARRTSTDAGPRVCERTSGPRR